MNRLAHAAAVPAGVRERPRPRHRVAAARRIRHPRSIHRLHRQHAVAVVVGAQAHRRGHVARALAVERRRGRRGHGRNRVPHGYRLGEAGVVAASIHHRPLAGDDQIAGIARPAFVVSRHQVPVAVVVRRHRRRGRHFTHALETGRQRRQARQHRVRRVHLPGVNHRHRHHCVAAVIYRRNRERAGLRTVVARVHMSHGDRHRAAQVRTAQQRLHARIRRQARRIAAQAAARRNTADRRCHRVHHCDCLYADFGHATWITCCPSPPDNVIARTIACSHRVGVAGLNRAARGGRRGTEKSVLAWNQRISAGNSNVSGTVDGGTIGHFQENKLHIRVQVGVPIHINIENNSYLITTGRFPRCGVNIRLVDETEHDSRADTRIRRSRWRGLAKECVNGVLDLPHCRHQPATGQKAVVDQIVDFLPSSGVLDDIRMIRQVGVEAIWISACRI